MLLKSLELHGFKTFPDKTKLNFGKGVTSVVGPNGSGKSNISDAIRWVLGEQSTKALRCSKMEDVVFTGTPKRKSQGFAQVTLSIDNSDRRLDFDSDELSVTRRYYRSGESEYMINKTTVRLKDINELFMDTGLGRDGYSIIGQGKIDEIISSKPENRREIFEEAAGISKYRYRKSEATNRLNKAEENLVRLRDILSELEGRVEPLKKESDRAKEFLELSAKKKTLEIGIWVNTLEQSDKTLKSQEEKINIARNQDEETEKNLIEIRQQSEKVYLEMNSHTAKADEIRRKISQVEQYLSEERKKIAVFENDMQHNIELINQLKDDINNTDISTKDLDEAIAIKEATIDKAKIHIQEIEENSNNNQLSLAEIENDISTFSNNGDELTKQLNKLTSKASEYKLNTLTNESSIVEIKARISSLNDNKFNVESDKKNDEKELKDYISMQNDLAKEIEALGNSIKGLNLKLENKNSKAENFKTLADKLNLDTMEATRKAKLLEDLERNLEGFQKSVKIVMRESNRKTLVGIHGPVSRMFKVDTKYATALETALGGAMQNVIVDTENDAKRAISYLKRNNGGRATFLPLNTIKGKTLNEYDLEDENGFIGIASELCSFDNKYRNVINSLLGRIVVAKDIDCAFSIAKNHSYRFRVVTLDGQVVNSGGSLTGGSLVRNSGLLSRTNDIEHIKKQALELKSKFDEANKNLNIIIDERDRVKEEITKYTERLLTIQQDEIKTKAVISNLKLKISTDNKSLSDIMNQIDLLSNRLDNLTEENSISTQRTNSLDEKIAELETKISNSVNGKQDLLSKRENVLQAIQEQKLEIVTQQKEVESILKEIMGIKDRKLDKAGRIQSLENQIKTLEYKNISCKEKIDELNLNEIELKNEIEKQNKNIKDLGCNRDTLEKKSIELRKLEQEKVDEKETIGRELARLEERKESLQANFDNIINKLWDEYELSMREAKEMGDKIDNLQSSQKNLNDLKLRIKRMGSVNVSAIEEYKEVGERYEFMKIQVDDVEKSKKELIHLINDLTHQMKDIFIVSFREINKNFNETFKELFGGGHANLVLTNPEDILNSGIEIDVQPKGKLVSRLEALSGGEKALVAISLYFAIMKVSPAPFCILDEIEAALDDVNVDRFASYLRKMNDNTQFVVITHRRGTMEGSDTLYGVTMQDEGVSKLLSLDISKARTEIKV